MFNNRADFIVADAHIVDGPDNGITKILQARPMTLGNWTMTEKLQKCDLMVHS